MLNRKISIRHCQEYALRDSRDVGHERGLICSGAKMLNDSIAAGNVEASIRIWKWPVRLNLAIDDSRVGCNKVLRFTNPDSGDPFRVRIEPLD